MKKSSDAPAVQKNIRGRLIIKQWRGQTVAIAWPRQRGASKNPSENWWRGTFGTAAQMAATPYHLDREFALAWTRNTKFRPEDILISAALGKLYEFVDPTGTIQGSMLTMGGNPQQTLDLVTNTPGSILWRSSAGWVGLRPTAGGLVLASVGTGALAWMPSENTGDPLDTSPTRLSLTADKTTLDLTGTPPVEWDEADYDFGDRWDAAAPDRIVFGPTDVGRVVLVTGGVRIDGNAVGQWSQCQLRHLRSDGLTKAITMQRAMIEANTENFHSVSLASAILEDGDYIQMRVGVQADTTVTLKDLWSFLETHFIK